VTLAIQEQLDSHRLPHVAVAVIQIQLICSAREHRAVIVMLGRACCPRGA
jgi:hypothetical protein